MNQIVRHAESMKIQYNGELLKPLSPKGYEAAIKYGRDVMKFVSGIRVSPQIRAIETGCAIEHGLKLGGGVSIDTSLDVIDFLPGHKPHEVGGDKQAYIDSIALDPGESFKVGARFANYLLYTMSNDGHFASEGIISVSHAIPMGLFLYTLGINEKETEMFRNLEGFSFTTLEDAGDKYLNISIPSRGEEYAVGTTDLDKICENKYHERLQCKRLK